MLNCPIIPWMYIFCTFASLHIITCISYRVTEPQKSPKYVFGCEDFRRGRGEVVMVAGFIFLDADAPVLVV